MITAESIDLPKRPMTYAEAGALIGRKPRFIRDRVKDGSLVGTAISYHTKRIMPLAFLKFLEESQTVENRRK